MRPIGQKRAEAVSTKLVARSEQMRTPGFAVLIPGYGSRDAVTNRSASLSTQPQDQAQQRRDDQSRGQRKRLAVDRPGRTRSVTRKRDIDALDRRYDRRVAGYVLRSRASSASRRS